MVLRTDHSDDIIPASLAQILNMRIYVFCVRSRSIIIFLNIWLRESRETDMCQSLSQLRKSHERDMDTKTLTDFVVLFVR